MQQDSSAEGGAVTARCSPRVCAPYWTAP